MSAATRKLLVDVHTHVYLPRYASLLRSRSAAPRILSRPTADGAGTEERLVILDNEPSGGRPVGPQYWDRDEKIKFMDKHGIDVSIVSTANPWLDFLPAAEAPSLAEALNADLDAYCATAPALSPALSRLYAFGLLPLVPAVPVPALLAAVAHIASLPRLRGVIMGTRGRGAGLDDPALEPVWAALARAGLVVFLHPHYGVPSSEWGDRENGHVLPLALGFPFETTIATTRLILAGVLDRHPSLRLLLAHAGGALPQLSARLASCVAHDPAVAQRLAHDARWYLGQLYFDAVAYGREELAFVAECVGRADSYEKGADRRTQSAQRTLGSSRLLFGTDHPFFPPLAETDKWQSVTENLEAIDGVEGWSDAEREGVRGGNAARLFGLV
ncbi:amidohydrolase 2 [Gloeophyllum trabeum ATCC 11539]|uniref:Amidohydrolase 2 n=1 Tax=Gloeophyllum trabeum (strain ATCC 11539 / FP-39264 / Madison 617) TaxID=670483 RepID=S7QIG3_GLOTA|nr:amidohydrolase 2 [Gloeophyllum trabeum ATCC 11539]EPQ59017.1 amidohydrolase 2 [Gloeophyllum trabeum ATCC 11539]